MSGHQSFTGPSLCPWPTRPAGRCKVTQKKLGNLTPKKKDFARQKPLLTPGLYDNLMHVWCLRVWKALCPIRSMQRISTCPWQRWSGSFRRRRGTEPAKGAQTLQVEQAEINEHHRPHLFNTVRHRMNIPSVWKKLCCIFQLLKQKQRKTRRLNNWIQNDRITFSNFFKGWDFKCGNEPITLKPAQSLRAYFKKKKNRKM